MKILKKLSVGLLASMIVVVSAPIGANAEWKQNSVGWWYAQGNSYLTGWQLIGSKWYYFDLSGYMKTGWQAINGSWYYFDNNGSMVENGVIDGYFLGADGKLISQSDVNTKVQLSEDQATENLNNNSEQVVVKVDKPDDSKQPSTDDIIRKIEKN
ncbi:choline-binding protein [Clostridium sp.]|uniref:choline-binding protein n=1 Tax=Clostridium sp. TaxID=1506 RepID=UPI00262CE95A|nr:choline-binding protein [Clostridium sp.]